METKNLTMQETHKAIAIELMEEILRGKDINTLLNRGKIFELLTKIKEKGVGYYFVNQELSENPTSSSSTIKRFEENKDVIFNNLVKEVAERVQFDIEFYKHGKATNNLRQRFAIIIKNEGFFSSKTKDKQGSAKDKTQFVLNATVKSESKSNQSIWASPNKPHRIVLEFPDDSKKTKKNFYFLYFETEQQMELSKELLYAMKLAKKENTNLLKSLNSMHKMIEGSHLFYTVLKLIEAKKKVKNRKVLLNSVKNYTNESFKKLNGFMKSACQSWVKKYKISKSISLNKPMSGLIKNKNLITNIKIPVIDMHFNTLSQLKKSVDIISKNLLRKRKIQIIDDKSGDFKSRHLNSPLEININKKSKGQSLASLDKSIGFEILGQNFLGKINDSSSTFDSNKFLNSKWFSINKKSLEIEFSNTTSLNKENIRNISNIFLNLDTNKNYKENYLMINGPKLNSKKFFKYIYKKNYLPFECTEKFIEPEYHALTFNQSPSQRFRALYLQIFHTIFYFDVKDLQLLEIHNIDNKFGKFEFKNPLEDFYFFLSIIVNKSYKIRTKLVKALKFEDSRFFIEFNLEHVLNLDSLEIFNPLEIKISLNLIPSACFDIDLPNEEDIDITAYNMNSYEIGFCIIDSEKISKKVFEFQFVKEGVDLPEENKIIINIMEENLKNSNSSTRFFGKMLNVGSDIYAIEELTREFFQSKMQDHNIDKETKDKLYNLNFSEEGSIYLRPPKFPSEFSSLNIENEKDFMKRLKTESGVSIAVLNKIFYNKEFDFIPYCEKYTSRKNIDSLFRSKTNCLNFHSEELFDVDKNIKQGDWVYKLKKIRKCFLSNFKGITENRNLVYHNYYTNNFNYTKLFDNNELKNSFRIRQENMFDIYDFSQIEEHSIENSENYQWRLGMQFVNKNEMAAFIFFLKDLRRRVNYQDKIDSTLIAKPIDLGILRSINRNTKTSVKTLKIQIDKFEFRKNFDLNENKSLQIKISKTSSIPGVKRLSKSMLESLDESELYGYRNSLTSNIELMEDIDMLRNMKSDYRIIPKEYQIDSEKFNTSQKIIKFSDSLDVKNKQFEIDAKPGVDKMYNLEIIFKGKKTTITLNSIINFENIILNRPQADVLILPIHMGDNKTVHGILHLKAWSYDSGSNSTFNDVFDRYMRQFPKIPRDIYNNYVSLGNYEPNIHRRLIMRQIHSQLKCDINSIKLENENSRTNLYTILKKYCIKYADDLVDGNWSKTDRWKELKSDNCARHTKNIKKFYINQKRNEFYQFFAKSEWELYLRKAKSNLKIKQIEINSKDIDLHSLYPNKADLLEMKMNKTSNFEELKFLYYHGLPPHRRLTAWEKILDIEKLVYITRDKLQKQKTMIFEIDDKKKENKVESMKNEIYLHYTNLVQSHSQFNINFSLIDIDLNFLTPISDNLDLNQIKFIAKAYFLWSELNITTDNFVKGSEAEKKRFVYFFGLLKIIQSLYSVFKSESETFWIIIGLSQIIELFYQSDPLYTGELSYTKVYVLITKLIMQNHLKKIFNKFVELEFPFEFFIAKLIPTLFCDFLPTELFLRLLDIIIFEASLKTNTNDRYEYLRVICTVPLTLLELNEKKVAECLTVKEMEVLFEDLIKKSFNNQKFLEQVRENSHTYYEMGNIMERFIEISSNTSWDWKRVKIQNKLSQFFYTVEKENKKFLSNSKISLEQNFIELYEEEVKTKLNSIHNALASFTPGEDLDDNSDKNSLHFCVTNFSSFDDSLNSELFRPEHINIYIEFENKITNIKEFNFKSKAFNSVLKIDYKENQRFINVENSEVFRIGFPSIIPKYMNIFLYTENNKNILGEYHLEVKKLDYMSPYKMKLESVDNLNKTVLEICMLKSSNEKIKDEDSDLFNLVFSHPNYIYNHKLNSDIIGVDPTVLEFPDDIAKNLAKVNQDSLEALNDQLHITSKFFVEEFKKNCLSIDFSHTKFYNFKDDSQNALTNKMEEILRKIFQDKEEIVTNILSWLKTNESSFEEILYALILADTSTITIYDKLKLLFDIGRMKNYLVNNEDYMTVPKMKEMLYCIYKRYMVYFTKSDVDRSIDYILNQENLNNRKFAFIYHSDNSKELENIIYDNNHISKKILSILKIKTEKFINVRKNLSIAASYLKNQFNLCKIKTEMLYICLAKDKNQENSMKPYNSMRIDVDVDSVRKTKCLVLIKGYSDSRNIQIQDAEEYSINFASNDRGEKRDKKENLIESLLKSEAKSIEMGNSNLTAISFDKFKDIFFNLPFVSDLIRAGCGFNYSYNENYIRTLSNVTVEMAYPERQMIRNFYFSTREEQDTYRNPKVQNFRINYETESSMCIKDLLELIVSKLQKRSDILEEFSYYLKNPNQISYFIMNKMTGFEEKIKLFDPLYSNDYIRHVSAKDQIVILFKLDSTEDISRISRRIVYKKSGYAKFKNVYPHYEWRECKIKQENYLSARFKCFNYNYYFKLNEKDVIIEDEVNKN